MRRFYTVFLVLTILPLAGLGARERGIGLRAKRAPDPFSSGTYRALVIGNDRYRDPRRIWKPLKTAVRDARAVADILRNDYGFGDVRLLLNATRKKTIRALNNLARVSRKNDSVVIYYAGHGYLRKKTREGFWIPVDAEGRDDSTFIPNVVIKSKLGIIADAARHVLLISDSCFSGALLREGNRGVNLEAKTRQ